MGPECSLNESRDLGVEVKVVHNASIMNAVGACGLQLYRFGQTVSICFFTDTWRPDSFYDRIKENRDQVMPHDLVVNNYDDNVWPTWAVGGPLLGCETYSQVNIMTLSIIVVSSR